MNKKFIVANWKMSPNTLAEAQQILEFVDEYLGTLKESHLEKFKIVFCPPFIFIEEIAKILGTSKLSEIAFLGAQDIFWQDAGADTGEIPGPMLSKLGVRYVIIGHSERRWKLEESDEIVNKKLKAALRNAMVPIVCIGEKVRDANFQEFLQKQVEATFKDLSVDEVNKCIIAYEPVWAISANLGARPDTPESTLESIKMIDEALNSKFPDLTSIWPRAGKIQNLKLTYLYGGSVNSKNVSNFLDCDEISGVLVGSASVNKEDFVNLLRKINVR